MDRTRLEFHIALSNVWTFQALILSNSVRKDYSVGEIVYFMAVDCQRISDVSFFLHNLWSAPLNIISKCIKLYMSRMIANVFKKSL